MLKMWSNTLPVFRKRMDHLLVMFGVCYHLVFDISAIVH